MTTPLPTFRALVLAAVTLHLSAVPGDGAALVLAQLAPATPLRDEAVVPALQRAWDSALSAVPALQAVDDSPGTAARLIQILIDVSAAYHRATMAYYGVATVVTG